MAAFKTGTLVWFWDGEAQRTGVIATWGHKRVTVVPTPVSKVAATMIPHTSVYDVIAWGGGRNKISFAGWLRMVRKHGAAYGYTKAGRAAVRKLEGSRK